MLVFIAPAKFARKAITFSSLITLLRIEEREM